MKTRFKVLSVLVFFLISLSFLLFLFSSEGYIANKVNWEYLSALKKEISKKEGDLGALKYRSEAEEVIREGGKDYVYFFSDDDIFDPVGNREEYSISEYEGMGRVVVFLLAGSLTFVYSLIIFVILPIIKKRRENGRNY